MIPSTDLSVSVLRDIAGEHLIQEAPYPVVAPLSLEMLAQILQHARSESLRILPLGMGSSFDQDFKLSYANVIAVMSGGLSGIQRVSAAAFRIAGGTPLSRLLRSDIVHEHKTVGGLIAGASGIHDPVEKALWSRLTAIEVMNSEGKLLRFAGACSSSAEDPGMAQLFFGSQGRLGMITAVELRGPLPLDVEIFESRTGGATLSTFEPALKRTELMRLMDPDGLFAW